MDFFIDGKWTPATTSRTIPVVNPATGETIDSVPAGNAVDADRAIASAALAFKQWRKVPMARRAKLQHAAAQRLRERVEEFARLLTLELGRPLAGAKIEIERAADLLDYFAEEGLRLRGEIPMINEENERVLVVKEPVGVVVAIAPFNYPITLLTFKLGAALMTGCTVVAKPASDTPLTTLLLAKLFHQVGYPPGVFNAITGSGGELGRALVEHPTPRKIGFTGSSPAGKRIAAMAAATNKRLTLEMGGQSPAIVCRDANLDVAIPALVRHAFANSGQFCYRVNRIYADREIYPMFIERFARAAAALKVGNGLDLGCDMGPIVSEEIFRTSVEHVADALSKGAQAAAGGARLLGGDYDRGYFFPPTVLVDTQQSMKIMREETFGPVVGVMPFASLPEAIEMANDSPFGLAGYVFSTDLSVALSTAESLEAGSVWVNNIHRSYNMVPFGGYKESGLGREKSRYGLEAYLELKTIYLSTAQ
ncbi:3-sulfolactaldehyde dehydrogenase [Georgfuchsia toluolica]|uniref:3-sulfolactaldehyde dehydrogenase n=1 Tax=Georgfuchsia toluolica TaxID=424218 RepID=A0A916N8H5_9PROT|nr:aldehyde dehydrogenase family protein [Georgfuchsia toluolica]CAG4883272.1 3-sulfolactaldehyde dehydrogenase [Georgfuchsia toluolica]